MKTAREWFEELPDDIEKMAVENAVCHWSIDWHHDCLLDAICMSFPWKETPQRFAFWFNVMEQHAKK